MLREARRRRHTNQPAHAHSNSTRRTPPSTAPTMTVVTGTGAEGDAAGVGAIEGVGRTTGERVAVAVLTAEKTRLDAGSASNTLRVGVCTTNATSNALVEGPVVVLLVVVVSIGSAPSATASATTATTLATAALKAAATRFEHSMAAAPPTTAELREQGGERDAGEGANTVTPNHTRVARDGVARLRSPPPISARAPVEVKHGPNIIAVLIASPAYAGVPSVPASAAREIQTSDMLDVGGPRPQ